MHGVDLNAYCKRIGFSGELAPTLPCLTALVFRHVCSIPFENVDVLVGRPINLDIDSLQRKLVLSKRGGYCYEQNGFFSEVLVAVGFDATVISARPRVIFARHETPPLTHASIRVTLDGVDWLVDVGIGGLSPSAPIRIVEDEVQDTPHDARRIVQDGGEFYLQVQLDGVWKDVLEFTGQAMPLPDRQVANFYTSQFPGSQFRKNAYCSLALANGDRLGLLAGKFTHRTKTGIARTFMVADARGLERVLTEEFGIEIPEGAILPEPISL
jgi:N-hydroxyarylamine O-acetyltransferase